MARPALCAVMGFLWERERISDEEVLSLLRESEQRRSVLLTDTLNITYATSKKNRISKKREAEKRKNHVIRATPVVTQLPVSWNSVLVRQQRLRQQQQHNTSSVSAHHSSVHDMSSHKSSHNKLNAQNQQHTAQSLNSKLEDNNIKTTVSWWSIILGYMLGTVYGSCNGVMSYFTSGNDTVDAVSEDDCDLDNILLTTNPLLLARKCLNKGNNETVKLSPLFTGLSSQTIMPHVNSIINRVIDMVQHYSGSPVSISLFEDALIAADYDGAALLPVGTVRWSPQQYSSNNVNNAHLERKDYDHLHNWQLIHQSNDTFLYVRPYKGTSLSQYRVVGRFNNITAVDFVEVQANPSLRQQWDSYTGKMKVIDKDDVSNSEVLHWEVKFPFPLSNRDYVFTRRSVVLPHTIITLNRSTQHPLVPPSRGYVRVDTYNSVMVVTADTSVDKDGFCFELIYVDDPKCNLPSSLSSWASSSGMMNFLAKVHSAALKRRQVI